MGRMMLAVAGAAVSLAGGLTLPLVAVAQTPNGETLFKQRCASCHQITAGRASVIGPNLYGVVNRKAAASPVAFKYSEALRKSGLTWTRANLDKYLTAPTKVVPGGKMVIAVPNAAQRGAIIDHLARAK